MSFNPDNIPLLELDAVIGFNGRIVSGLLLHPDETYLIYTLGNSVIQKNIQVKTLVFLSAHSSTVSCLAVSKSGRYIASGQTTSMGFKADIFVWDNSTQDVHAKLVLHKAKVEDLAFSPNEKFLASLGGPDDGSVVIWNVERGDALCGSPAAVYHATRSLRVRFSNLSDNILITAGNNTIRVWEIDARIRRMHFTECRIGQLRRTVRCIEVSPDDEFFYCGTSSGDILKIKMRTKSLKVYGPLKNKFAQGISALKLLKSGELLVGSGDGMVSVCKDTNFRVFQKVQLEGGVTSIALPSKGHQLYVGTDACNIYSIREDFREELFSSSHGSSVNCVAFPHGTSELFATCSNEEIRVWLVETCRELLRIVVPNSNCNVVDFTMDGRWIISVWSDGLIRGFTPETGKLMLQIDNAHRGGATAMACCKDSRTLISGGGDGQVRVWHFRQNSFQMIASLKEHRGAVTHIALKSNDMECVSAGADGACIVWDLVNYVSTQLVLATTMFRCVCYHPSCSQIIMSRSDRKIMFWELLDRAAVRELEGAETGSISTMDFAPDGRHFITGGDDKLLRVWGYASGEVTHVGFGHSGSISKVCICPSGRWIVSTSQDGAVFRWNFPNPPQDNTA